MIPRTLRRNTLQIEKLMFTRRKRRGRHQSLTSRQKLNHQEKGPHLLGQGDDKDLDPIRHEGELRRETLQQDSVVVEADLLQDAGDLCG